jgi:polysaccharide deacetylase family protein (PEP-CTERM system associated)
MITFTLDLEDYLPPPNPAPRYPQIMERVIDFLDGQGVKGTFFVVGRIAREQPDLVRRLANKGHEIACHSAHHIPLNKENPVRFRGETADTKALLEDLTGAEVTGYRAPIFSLTPASRWALPLLQEMGFSYSSSVMPMANPLYGFPGAPRRPFRWKNSLLELPCPVGRIGPVTLPFLGGIYMRYLPLFLIRHLLRRTSSGEGNWTYCHPYDFDPEQPFARMEHASLITSLLLWFNRGGTYDVLEALFKEGIAPPFRERIAAGEFNAAPVF